MKQIVETVNGSKEAPVYLFKAFLKKEESTDLKWGSLSSNNTIVAADVVSMDSELPLKKRDSIQKATGDLPKMGMKKYLNERQLQELDILSKKDGKEQSLIKKLFADPKAVYVGVLETIEFMFLQALSSGITVISDANNVGLGIRVDFGVPESNKFGAEVIWTDPINSVPIDDIVRIKKVARSKGDILKHIFMDDYAFNNFKKSKQVKESYAFYVGFTGSTIPVPNLIKVNEMLKADIGVEIIIIDRVTRVEKDGVQTIVTPWTEGAVTFTTTTDLGTYTHGDVAEMNHPVKDVEYETVDGFVLVSKYRKNDPVREFTSSQANVLPVLDNVASLYMMDSKEAETIEGQTEGDANIDIFGQTLVKQDVIDALIVIGFNTTNTISDDGLIRKVNGLSDEDEAALKTELGI